MSKAMSATATQVYRFPSEFIENLQVLANGDLLLSTMKSPTGLLYTIDPRAADPQAKLVTSFDTDVTALTGLAPLPGNDLYAVGGGEHTSFAFVRGSMAIYVVSLKAGEIVDSISVPDTASLNGMAALPLHPHTLLSADSIDGRIFSIDTKTHEVRVILENSVLGPGTVGASSGIPAIGVNGLRTRGEYLYFTNSRQGTFVRVRIDEFGNQIGDFEILARSNIPSEIYDDFTFDDEGNVYIAVHSSTVVKITPAGVQTTFAGSSSDSILDEPTSVALADDHKSIYVATGGNFRTVPRRGGQIIKLQL